MNWLALVPSALSAVSSLFSKSPPQYQAPPPPNLGQMAGQLSSAAPIYDVNSSPVYQSMLSQLNQGLPQDYQNALIGQAQKEAQTSFDQMSNSLGLQRDKAQQSAVAQMNKLGLLSSGALGTQLGYIDQSYGNQLGNMANNLQNQLSGVGTNLMQQAMQQRGQLMQNLTSLSGQQLQGSIANRNSLASLGNTMNQYNMSNAQNQYSSGLNNWQVGQANQGQLLNSLGSAASIYGIYNSPASDPLFGRYRSGSSAQSSSPYTLSLSNPYFRS